MSEFNGRVLERIFGWRRVQAPKYDYDGPLPQQGEVLVGPSHDDKNYQWPARGVVPFDFFFKGVPWYAFDTDANADYSVLPEVAKWTPQDQYRFNDEMERIINQRAVALRKPPSAWWTLLKVGDFARAALAAKESAE